MIGVFIMPPRILLCGLIAAEIGADIEVVKAGGLLHDIGKAMTHEVQGSHVDIGGDIAEKYGVKSLPRLVVIDAKGKVHYIHDGYAPGDEKKLKEVLDKLTDAKK